jgi:hypothetical protein
VRRRRLVFGRPILARLPAIIVVGAISLGRGVSWIAEYARGGHSGLKLAAGIACLLFGMWFIAVATRGRKLVITDDGIRCLRGLRYETIPWPAVRSFTVRSAVGRYGTVWDVGVFLRDGSRFPLSGTAGSWERATQIEEALTRALGEQQALEGHL